MAEMTTTTWAVALLKRLHDPVTPENVRAIEGWEKAEGGHWHNDAKYNPLNTTQPMPGAGNTGSQGNIKIYRSWGQGLDATVKTLHNGHYANILSALHRGNSAENVASAIASSPWGSGSLVSSTIAGTDSHNSSFLSKVTGTVEDAAGGVVGAAGDAAGAVLGTAGDAVDAVTSPFQAVLEVSKVLLNMFNLWRNLVAKLFDPNSWADLLKFLVGLILLYMGMKRTFELTK